MIQDVNHELALGQMKSASGDMLCMNSQKMMDRPKSFNENCRCW
jgi:hypothetical protein